MQWEGAWYSTCGVVFNLDKATLFPLAVFVAGAALGDSALAAFVAGAAFGDSALAFFVAGAAFGDSVLAVFVVDIAFGNIGMEGIEPHV